MHRYRSVLMVFVILANGFGRVSYVSADDTDSSPDLVRAAISKSIPLLEKGTIGSVNQRQCFTCHNQAIPALALAEVRKRGFAVDADNFDRQIGHTAAHLERGRDEYLAGRGQGGKVITAGYALWTLEAGGRTRDETTAAVVRFLLEYQKETNHWMHRGNRPPSSGSDFTTTYLALRGLVTFGTEQQKSEIETRTEQVKQWLLTETPKDTEDRAFRLWALPYVDAGEEAVQKATSELIDNQQDDGGWGQAAGMDSDAYATGTVLVALLRAADVPVEHSSVRRGVQYLISSQLDDGSWHVVTRAKPFQTYFESGFPHGKDQFISIAASSWATLALVNTLPETP
ncbi:prenyltransferase/squalene oxidase repeat-containing protein [Pirellulales bacterium]|nr:prenyltransferase/squalene oxidase repeat-containing protein [Pirellulales bacterium]MDC0935206.1 prenyltransferase/squalene oxidase repeat-containing protein [Pirellulales bacterium]